MTIKLMILDLDGTLADTKDLIFNIIKKEINKDGYHLSKNFKSDMGDWPLKKHLAKEGIKKIENILLKRLILR